MERAEPKLSNRVINLKEQLRSATAKTDVERIHYLLEVYKKTDGLPPAMRRAKLFDELCSNKTLVIDDNPFVGTLTRYQPGGYPYPEHSCRYMKKQADFLCHSGEMTFTEEDRGAINKAVDYWADRNMYNRTRDIILEKRGVDINIPLKAGVWTGSPVDATMIAGPVDYKKVLNKGLNSIITEVEEAREGLDIGVREDFNKWNYYNAQDICLNAVIKLARRYASLAKEMAEDETDPVRKEELQKIAETCEWVPANPARSLYEAIQSYWFIMIALWLEVGILGNIPGRLSQYFYPFYKQDKEDGKIDDEKAIEMLSLLFLKFWGLGQFQSSFFQLARGSALVQKITLGGLTPDGRDATNELDLLILETQRRLQLPEPEIQLNYHDKLSEEFLLKCIEVIRETGLGQPAFFNNDATVARHLSHWGEKGITLEEARDVCYAGCVQGAIEHRTDFVWEGAFNNPKMVELALNNGKDPLSGVQMGVETGDAGSFHTYEQFHEAVKKQLEYFLPLSREAARVSWQVARNEVPVPFSSTLVDDCIAKGEDLIEGGARYSIASGTISLGMVDLGNSLAAIKKLVFEDKKLTLEQIREAVTANFEGNGYGDIQKVCLDAPKYGNDDNYVDDIVQEWYEIYWQTHQQFPDYLGRTMLPEAFSATGHVDRGKYTGALPSGRKARVALADASVSAFPGTDISGPTALVRSATKVIDTIKWGSNHLNMKFHPSALKGREGAKKLLALIKTYMDLGGYHIQFNCVSGDTLKKAQENPVDHRDLVVRVAGFSAYFVLLDKSVQDELIMRTEVQFE